jgi:hypothetical protein
VLYITIYLFKTFSSGLRIPDPIDLSCQKARLNKLVTAGGQGRNFGITAERV